MGLAGGAATPGPGRRLHGHYCRDRALLGQRPLRATVPKNSGTTDVSGRTPGDPIEFYNTESPRLRFLRSRQGHVLPDHAAARGQRVGRRDAPYEHRRRCSFSTGWSFRAAATSWTSETRRVASTRRAAHLHWAVAHSRPSAAHPARLCSMILTPTLIRYSAAADPTLDAAAAQEVLSALDDYEDSIPLVLTRLDSEEAPFAVRRGHHEGAGARRLHRVGWRCHRARWSFSVPEDIELLSPSGEALIDPCSSSPARPAFAAQVRGSMASSVVIPIVCPRPAKPARASSRLRSSRVSGAHQIGEEAHLEVIRRQPHRRCDSTTRSPLMTTIVGMLVAWNCCARGRVVVHVDLDDLDAARVLLGERLEHGPDDPAWPRTRAPTGPPGRPPRSVLRRGRSRP